MAYNSLQILANSLEDIVIKELYFVSGIPKCSVSMVIKDNSKSAPFFDSILIKKIIFN